MSLLTKRLARAATIAAAIVASSGSLAMGRPLFATLGDVAFKLTAGFSEVEEVRRKINRRPRAETWSIEGHGANSLLIRQKFLPGILQGFPAGSCATFELTAR